MVCCYKKCRVLSKWTLEFHYASQCRRKYIMEIIIKLDRLKLPNVSKSPAQNVLQKISNETGVEVKWETGSKEIPVKEPYIKISGLEESVNKAKEMLLEKMEVQSNRVVMKLEVTYLEHPSLIGRRGNLIRKVMETTGCHIHFPDANACKCRQKANQKATRCQVHFPNANKLQEKNNQVSIYGDPLNVERARVMIRALLPIQIQFDAPTTSFFDTEILNSVLPNYDCTLPETKFLGSYNGLLLYSAIRQNKKCYIVRCNQEQFSHLRKDITMLMEHICGTNGANLPPVYMITDIMAQHHAFVRGPNNSNIEGIVKKTGAEITFPDKHSQQKGKGTLEEKKIEERSITISGSLDSVYVAWLEIMNYLPVNVSFDVNSTRETKGEYVDFLRDLGIVLYTRPNDKYYIKNVTLKGPEKFSKQMLQYRQHLLHLPSLGFKADIEDIKLASDFLTAHNKYFPSSPTNTIPRSLTPSMTNIMNRDIGYETLQQLAQSLNGTISHQQLLAITNNTSIPVMSDRSLINEDQFIETGHYYITTTKDFKIQTRPILFSVEQNCRTASTGGQSSLNENGYYWKSKLGENSIPEDQLLMNNNNWIKNIPYDNGSSSFSEVTQNQCLAEQIGKSSELPQSLFMENQNRETTLAEDYYRKKVLAARAMRRPIESTQVPTSLWSGYGFSKSMPAVKHYNCYQLFSDSSSEDLDKYWENEVKNLDIWSNEKESKLSHSNYFDFLRMRLPFDTNKQTKDILPELLWKHGLHQHIDTFNKQEIDFQAFLMLDDHDLHAMGIAHQARIKIGCLIRELRDSTVKCKSFDAAPGAERKSSQDRLDSLQIC